MTDKIALPIPLDLPAPTVPAGPALPASPLVEPRSAQTQPKPLLLSQEVNRIVIYGDPGGGKTTLASQFPRSLFIDTDGGMVSVAIAGQDAHQFEPSSYRDLEYLYTLVHQHGEDYDNIVIDSFTELQRLLLDEIVDEEALSKNEVRATYKFVPEQREYLANQRQMHRFLHGFRRLGKGLIVTAGVRMVEGQRAPEMSPGLLSIVERWADVIGELVSFTAEDGSLQRYFITQPSQVRKVKTRFFALAPYVEVPAFRDQAGKLIPLERNGAQIILDKIAQSYAASPTYTTTTTPPGVQTVAPQPTEEGATA